MKNKSKKPLLILLSSCLLILLGIHCFLPLRAEATSTGATIGVTVEFVNPGGWRNSAQYNAGIKPTFLGNDIYFLSNISLTLLGSDRTTELGTYQYSGQNPLSIPLPADGDYYIRLDTLVNNPNRYYPMSHLYNGSSGLMSNIQTSAISEKITVENGKAKITAIRWMLDRKAYGLTTNTAIGSFSNAKINTSYGRLSNNDTTIVYYPTFNNGTRNGSFSNAAGERLYTHIGIYYEDSANLYTGMSTLNEPVLTGDDALEWRFIGWYDQNNNFYTTEDAVRHIITEDFILDAAFERITHTVAFKTDESKGLINGSSADYVITIDGNTALGAVVPSVTAKDGYRFIGWFSEPGTTNEISETDIQKNIVNEDITYYAKYEPLYTVTYADGAGGTVFEDKQFTDLNEGDSTPSFGSDPARSGWKFLGWTPEVAQTVTGNVVYFATWAPLTAEDAEYTVIYTDDVGRVAFEDVVFTGLKAGDDTPQYPGTPTWEGFTFVEWNPEVSDTVNGNAVYFAAWKKNEPTPTAAPGKYTVIFDPADHGELVGRGIHQVPDDKHVPLVPGINATDPYTFVERWEVVALDGETDGFIQVGDILNEANISHLNIHYNVTFRALYETSEPTAAPTATPTAKPTAKPTDPPSPTGAPNFFYFSFTKEWLGDPGEEISFTLYHSNGTVRNHRFNRKKISDTEWLYEAWLSTSDDYYVIEDRMSDYSTRYVNIGTHAEDTTRVYNGGKIINSVIPKTGDSSHPVLWSVLSGAAVFALGVLLVLSRRKKNK